MSLSYKMYTSDRVVSEPLSRSSELLLWVSRNGVKSFTVESCLNKAGKAALHVATRRYLLIKADICIIKQHIWQVDLLHALFVYSKSIFRTVPAPPSSQKQIIHNDT